MTVKQKTQRAVWLLGIAALVLVWCSKSSPLYAFNDWMDANIFFTMGKSMLHGRVLYRDVFDHKGPVLYLLYGLAACVDNTGFGGVLLLETAAFAAFLWLGLRSAEAICGRALHPAWMALPAAAVAASRAFSHGGSAEELLLPLLAAALFGAVSTLRASRPMPLRRVVLHGFLAGCALWLKYTVLGFYLVWAVLLAVFLLWAALRRPAAAGTVAALAAGLAFTSLMGGYLVYYGLVLSVFAPLGLVPLILLVEKCKTPAAAKRLAPATAVALALVWCAACSPNRALRWRTADSMPQRRFARQINGASLLNYGTLDGGFYTAAGVLPPCRYFCVTNMPLDDQWAEQNALLAGGAVDYVVALTGDLGTAFPRYAVVDQCSCDGGEGLLTWYLYKRQA